MKPYEKVGSAINQLKNNISEMEKLIKTSKKNREYNMGKKLAYEEAVFIVEKTFGWR